MKITVNDLLKLLKEIKATHNGDCIVEHIDIHAKGTAVTIYHHCGEAMLLAKATNEKQTKTVGNISTRHRDGRAA